MSPRAASPAAAPPAIEIPGRDDAGLIVLCDHARPDLPPEYGDLGLPPESFARHIAYDIGAEEVARLLAAHFSAPLAMTTYSRLLIDPNRGADDPTLTMRLSDGAIVPGNAAIDDREIARRRQAYWQPYRDLVRARLDAMIAAGPAPVIVSVHSFTPSWKGRPRPWSIGALWDRDDRLARPFIDSIRAEGVFRVGDNEPYDGALKGDTLDEHATRRGLCPLLIEYRQDLIKDRVGQEFWARLTIRHLEPLLRDPARRRILRCGSRCR